MIHAVIVTAQGDRPWQAPLLGHSWGRARQPGELVQLVDTRSGEVTPCHPQARLFETQRWSPHPFTGDDYPPYQKAAALLEWLFVERIEGTVLLLEPTSVFGGAVTDEVKPGQARATAWPALPRGEGPFGLGPGFEFLAGVSVDRTLALQAIGLPVLIHASDLRKLVTRWLELMSIIRVDTANGTGGPRADADKVAYAIAAAEARIAHAPSDLGLLDAGRLIPAADGTIAWDPATYRMGDAVQPASAAPGPGREVLTLLAELVERNAQEMDLSRLTPHRREGVREGKILGAVFLEIPGREDTVSLNASGAAIWEACDGTRSLAAINGALETRFEMPPGSLQADVEVVIKGLERIGALTLGSP